MLSKLRTFLREDDGATAIEYGMLVVGIALVIIAAVFAAGESLVTFFAGIPALFAGG